VRLGAAGLLTWAQSPDLVPERRRALASCELLPLLHHSTCTKDSFVSLYADSHRFLLRAQCRPIVAVWSITHSEAFDFQAARSRDTCAGRLASQWDMVTKDACGRLARSALLRQLDVADDGYRH